MKTITAEIQAGNAQLLYVVQDSLCNWGKGLSLSEALKNYRRVTKKRKPTHLFTYLCMQDLEADEAYAEVQISWTNITYSTEKVILLQSTKF